MRPMIPLLALLATTGIAQASEDPFADFKNADRILNETYKAVEARLADDPDAKHRLIHAQRAWIAFRDAECTFQSGGEDGGTIAPAIVAGCQASLTADRTGQLQAYLNCEEGDLACPVPSE